MLRVAISGADGRMGKMLVETALNADDVKLTVALTAPESPNLGKDAGAFVGRDTGVCITDDLNQLDCDGIDVLIDFTRPKGTLTFLPICQKNNIAMVIGTTGFSAEEKTQILEASRTIPIVLAPNMSTGVNVTLKLLEQAAKALKDYDCEILEMHHSLKVDAPSGTAIEMGRTIANARGQNLDDVAVWAREGHTGERVPGTIGFATLRGGDVVGDHRVIFASKGERIEIAHLSSSRQGYADGAFKAARFLVNAKPGLYSMSDVLGL